MRKTFLTFLVDLFLTNIIEYIIELTSEIIKRLLKKLFTIPDETSRKISDRIGPIIAIIIMMLEMPCADNINLMK